VSIKAKQVAGVTTLVVVIVAVLSTYHLATVARRSLEETGARGELLARSIFLRAAQVVAGGGDDPYRALSEDGGIRSILEASTGFDPYVTHAAIVDTEGRAVAHNFRSSEGTTMVQQADLRPVVKSGSALVQLEAVYSDRTFEIREPILVDERPFGEIRIGVNTLLVRGELRQAMRRAAGTVLAVLIISSLVAILLAQWMLRPIHVIQSSLSRLGRGELDVTLDLPGQEFRDLGTSFEAVSAQLAAVRARALPGASTDFESVMENLEDAVALFSPAGELIFSNTAMRALLPEIGGTDTAESVLAALPKSHPVKMLVERTLAGRESQGPVSMAVPGGQGVSVGANVSVGARSAKVEAHSGKVAGAAVQRADGGVEIAGTADSAEKADASERMLMSHAIQDSSGRFLGAMLVARNVGYLSQVHSTLNYSRKLAALGRLMAGVAHEVKNPLNAMTIHLELLKQKLAAVREPITVPAGSGPARSVDLTKHVGVIADEIRRLDQVVVGFLKFARPDELKLQPVRLDTMLSDVVTTATPEAERRQIAVKVDCASTLPPINADPGMLRQALLNLALNACQAMPDGGTLKIACRTASRRRLEIDVEDTGVGIPPDHLSSIFDLYFTTKEKGTGIGLSMVYRIVQLHDGEVEVQSTPGMGTRFRLIFPQA
jgi:signal transduction histidine kinase